VLKSPFPATVSFQALGADEPAVPVHPAELDAYPRACDRRKQEFLLGRAAAHLAIAALCGSSEEPIGRGSRGQPVWPPGLVGSISHTRGLALAAVARRQDCRGLGVDVERRDRRVTPDVVRLLANAAERAWVEAADPDLRLKLLFSAKESVFKAPYPQAEVFLGYKDAELSWDPEGEGFVATLLKGAGPEWPAGSSLRVGTRLETEYLLTWVMLSASSALD
jgi:enterobactin synthetase component D